MQLLQAQDPAMHAQWDYCDSIIAQVFTSQGKAGPAVSKVKFIQSTCFHIVGLSNFGGLTKHKENGLP